MSEQVVTVNDELGQYTIPKDWLGYVDSFYEQRLRTWERRGAKGLSKWTPTVQHNHTRPDAGTAPEQEGAVQ